MEERKMTYVRVDAPDKDKLSELVVRAIGPSRNQTEFAKELGVNPSTLSRIINKKNSGASADDLILAIAAHADPVSGVTEEMLMRAHGMVSANDERNGMITSRHMIREYEENVIRLLSTEILDRGYSVNSMNREVRYPIVRGAGVVPDVVFETNAIEAGNHLWAIDTMFPRMMQSFSMAGCRNSMDANQRRSSMMILRNVFDRVGRIISLPFSGKVPKDEIPQKFSLVIADSDAYAAVIEEYKEFTFPMHFSFIYMDLEHGRVTEEFNCKCTDGTTLSNFFTPVEGKYGDDNDDKNFVFFFFDDDNE